MAYSISDLVSLVSETQALFKKDKVTDIATPEDMMELIFAQKLLNEKQTTFDGGNEYDFNVTSELGVNAKQIEMFEEDNFSVRDSFAQGSVPYKFTQGAVLFDIKEKMLNKPDPVRVVDAIKLRTAQEEAAMLVHCERMFWENTATTSNKDAFGIDYWITPVSSGYLTVSDHGFIGGDPSGFTGGCAGLTVADYPNWQNYAGNYSTISHDDLVRAMKRAIRKTAFKSPLQYPDYNTQAMVASRFQIYCGEEVIDGIEDVGEDQNESLGRDIFSMNGVVTLGGNPFVYVPALDGSSYNKPVYMVNWGVFGIVINKGLFFKKDTRQSPTSTDVVQTVIELGWNTVCHNRRLNAVFTYSAS